MPHHAMTRLVVTSLCALGLVSAADVLPSTKPASAPVFQLRLVAHQAEANTEEMAPLKAPQPAQKLHVQKAALLDQTSLKEAFAAVQGPDGEVAITIVFTPAGTEKFAQVTRDNIGERLAIVIDGKLLSAPNIMEAITGGVAKITGKFTLKEADDLVKKITDSITKP
jgi:preprotein translocase subunit SecD